MYHLISYDLALPGQNYPLIIGRLEELGAQRVLWSTWSLFDFRTADQVWRDLVRYIDANDRLLVTGILGWQSTTNLFARPVAA